MPCRIGPGVVLIGMLGMVFTLCDCDPCTAFRRIAD